MPPSPKRNTPSRMAEAATAVRAAHHLHEQGAVFDDPYAINLTSIGWRFIAKNKRVYHFIAKKLLKVLRPVHGQVLARSRFTEDRLMDAISAGITQYVILGAGFDSFALRRQDLSSSLKIFELDHPHTQQLKQNRLKALRITPPDTLTYLPIDFEQEHISQILKQSAFDHTQPTFFSWLGTVPYLTQEVVFETLNNLAHSQASGSELIFDYANTKITSEDQPAVDKLMKFTQRRGEPLITQFDASKINPKLNQLRFDVLENVSQAEWRLHYYNNPQTADLRPLSAAYITHLRVR